MTTAEINIDEILEKLDPKVVNEKAEKPHRDARHKYKLENNTVKGRTNFKKEVIKYMQHHHKETYGAEMPEEMAWSRAKTVLNKVYEKGGGLAHAIEQAEDGKMDRILNALADQFEAEHKNAYIVNVIDDHIDEQDHETHVKVVDQYKKKFASLLPDDFKAKDSAELAPNYSGLIQSLSGIVTGVKKDLGKYKSHEGEEE